MDPNNHPPNVPHDNDVKENEQPGYIYKMIKRSTEVNGLTLEQFEQYKLDRRVPPEVPVRERIELLKDDTLQRFNDANGYMNIWGEREADNFFTARIRNKYGGEMLCQVFYEEIKGADGGAEKLFEKVANGGRRKTRKQKQKQKKQKQKQKKQKQKQKTRRS